MSKELLTTKEIIELFGVHQSTVYRWLKQGQLPAVRIGKFWFVPREALEQHLQARLKLKLEMEMSGGEAND